MGLKCFRTALLLGAAALGTEAASAILTPAYAQETTRAYAIEPQELDDALREFGRQAGRDILFAPGAVAGKRSPGVEGQMTERQALEALLAGTGLRFEQTASNGYAVQDPASPTQLGGAEAPSSDEEEIVVIGTSIRGQQPVGAQAITIDREAIERSGVTSTQEIVRTLPQNFNGGFSEDAIGLAAEGNTSFGTSVNLRGLGSNATLILLNGRRLAGSGLTASATDVSGIPFAALERVEILPDGASAIYGSDAVGGVVNYVLREDYDGAQGSLSLGGATRGGADELRLSHLLGGGVGLIDFLLSYEFYSRDDVNAADRDWAASSDLRPFGGDNFDGRGGNPGNIIIGANIWAIPAGQDGTDLEPADLAAGVPNFYNRNEARVLVPRVERQSVFGRATTALSPNFSLFGEMLYSARDSRSQNRSNPRRLTVTPTNPFYVHPTGGSGNIIVEYSLFDDLGPSVTEVNVEFTDAAIGFGWDVGSTWQLRFTAARAIEGVDSRTTGEGGVNAAALTTALNDTNPATAFNPFGDGSNTNPTTLAAIQQPSTFYSDSTLTAYTLVADGVLFQLPGGDVRAAIGADHRAVGLSAQLDGSAFSDFDRTVDSVFGELRIPFVDEGFSIPAINSLEFSIAGRYESYSDFGEVVVPKLGLSWHVTPMFEIFGTWGASYRAPSPADMLRGGSNFVLVLNVPDGAGTSDALVVLGNNPNLDEETAETSTFGMDWEAVLGSPVRFSASYFRTDFTNRIIRPVFTATLNDPAPQGVIDRTPTPEEIAAACSSGEYLSGGDCTAQAVAVIADFRKRNAAEVSVEGIDVGASSEAEVPFGTLQLSAFATHYLTYEQRLTSLSPLQEPLNTVGNLVDTRARLQATLDSGRFSWTAAMNYTGDYTDNLSAPQREIDSWVTFDASVAYRGDDWVMRLNVLNFADEDPPFVNSPSGLAYDAANADPIGRTISLSLSKEW